MTSAPVTFSVTQTDAIDAVLAWFRSKSSPTFKLFGYAGTGKTTIAKTIAERVEREPSSKARRYYDEGGEIECESMCGGVVFAAYTGKAASVLRDKGCAGASTIHSLIYRVTGERGEPPRFILDSPALRSGAVALVIIDECSMVGTSLGEDLLSFGVPVLVLGDPAQLPPVGDGGYFTNGEPDVLLTEIHRQKEGCGILDIATAVRLGQPLPRGVYSESQILPMTALGTVDPFAFDQVIVGRNATRRCWNKRMRTRLGYTDAMPVPGDKLICLRNNKQAGIMNGEFVTVLSAGPVKGDAFRLKYERDGREFECLADTHYLLGKEGDALWGGDGALFFDYGYAITGHKSQGSQFKRVLVIDESSVFRQDAAKWLYTAATRASEHLTVIR